MELTDDNIKIYQQGIQEGMKHQSPAPATLENLKRMSEDINNLKIKTAVIDEKMDSLVKGISEIKGMIHDHIEEEGGRYNTIMAGKADKWVERFSVAIISAICLSVLYALV